MVRWGVVVATLLPLVIFPAGCRQGDAPPSAPSGIPIAWHFSVGDAFTYSAWMLDPYGYLIPSSQSRDMVHVTATGVPVFGMNDVVILTDSAYDDSLAQWSVDTLYLHCAQNGDVYRFGFVADAAHRLEGRVIPPTWDRIAAFSLGFNSPWTVGTDDSAGGAQFTGVIGQQQDFFAVDVNGVQTIVASYHIEITADGFDRGLWIANAPSAFTRILDVPMGTGDGILRELDAIGSAAR